MAPRLAGQCETMTSQDLRNLGRSADRKALAHGTASSKTFAPSASGTSEGLNQSASASLALATASSSVSPALAQPGSSGKTADQRFASASNSITRRSFIAGRLLHSGRIGRLRRAPRSDPTRSLDAQHREGIETGENLPYQGDDARDRVRADGLRSPADHRDRDSGYIKPKARTPRLAAVSAMLASACISARRVAGLGVAMRRENTSADECPNCSHFPSYTGGYCFKCGHFRPSKRVDPGGADEIEVTEFMKRSFGTRVSDVEMTEEQLDVQQEERSMRWLYRKPKPTVLVPVHITVENIRDAAVTVRGIVERYGTTSEGELIRAIGPAWQAVAERLGKDWSHAYEIPPRIWEEIVAATFDKAGYDEVVLTSRSGDHGRDVIAVRQGVCCVRIIGSVKAYKPGHLVEYDDVRALAGVLHGDLKATKGIITTTSDFPPNLLKDPFISPLMPYRLETMNGVALQKWLAELR